MGLFGSSKKKVVGTSVMRVIEDEDIPSNNKESVISAIMRGESVSDNILDTRLNGRVPHFERAYAFAKSNRYIYGLPNEEVSENGTARLAVENQVSQLEGTPVTATYYRLQPMNFLHLAWKHLSDTEGYNPYTNEAESQSTLKSSPVYVKNIVVHLVGLEEDYPDLSLIHWDDHPQDRYTLSRGSTGTTTKTPVILFEQSTNQIQYELEWESTTSSPVYTPPYLTDPVVLSGSYTAPLLSENVVLNDGSTETTEIVTEFLFKPMPLVDLTAYYHQIRFKGPTPDIQGYWSYEQGIGTYPDIDNAGDSTVITETEYMPFMFFISNSVLLGEESKRFTPEYKSMQKMLDHFQMDFGQVSDKLAENPDIADVKQAAMVFGIPMDSTDLDEKKYIYHHLKHLYDTTSVVTSVDSGDAAYSIGFSDADFRIDLDYAGIVVENKTGEVTTTGEVTSTVGTYSVTETVTTETRDGYETEQVQISYDKLTLQYQDTSSTYQELTIYNPSMVYFVEDDNAVYVSLSDSEGRLILPMYKPLMSMFTYEKKERLYLRSLHFVFNSLVIIKVKWYQTGIFKAFVMVVAIVLMVISAGTSIPAIAAFLGTGLLVATVVFIIVSIAMSFVFKLIVKELGPQNSLIAAVVLIIASALVGYFDPELLRLVSAEALLMMGTGLAQGVGKYASELINEYSQKYDQFEDLLDERSKELKAAEALLDGGIDIDPFEFIGLQPIFIPGESPEMFYQRTVHSGNIGTLAFDYLHNYHAINLQLPTAAETLGK